jgi:hypothetical protein
MVGVTGSNPVASITKTPRNKASEGFFLSLVKHLAKNNLYDKMRVSGVPQKQYSDMMVT